MNNENEENVNDDVLPRGNEVSLGRSVSNRANGVSSIGARINSRKWRGRTTKPSTNENNEEINLENNKNKLKDDTDNKQSIFNRDDNNSKSNTSPINNIKKKVKIYKWIIIGFSIFSFFAIFLCIFAYKTVSSFSINFSSKEVDVSQAFDGELESIENNSYEEIDVMMKDYTCKESIFERLLNNLRYSLNIDFQITDACGLFSYMNLVFDQKIKKMSLVGNEKNKSDLHPGLLLSTLLYLYQGYESDEKTIDLSNPLEIVVDMMEEGVINVTDLKNMIDQFVLRTYYPIFKFNELSSKESDNGVLTVTYGCVKQDKFDYYMDELKYHLFLRYGEKVSGVAIGENDTSNLGGHGYEYQYNLSNAWAKTQPACKISGEAEKNLDLLQQNNSEIVYKLDKKSVNNSINFFNSRGVINDLSENIHMTKYLKMATKETNDVDDITINVDEVDYTYKDGFIYNRFSRFQKENHLYNSLSTPKTIENIISILNSDSQPINSILGYGTNGREALYSSNGGYTCNYDLGLVKSGDNVANGNLSNIKVRLLFSDKANNNNMPIQGEELVDFEKYILGVTYAENEGGPFAALQAQSIAARSYALTRPSQHSKVTLEQENGVWILSIRNSNNDQVYCNPDTGCYACKNINTYVSANVEIEDSWGCGKTLWKDAIGPNEEIRSAVSSVAGKLLIDANTEKVKYTTYSNTKTQNWNEYARSDLDYVEILKKTYGDTSINDAHCESTGGSYATWKQYGSPWSNNKMGNSSETIGKVGCFATSIAINIARSGASLLIKDFNPGSFVDAVEEGFSNANFNRAWDYIATKVTPDFDSYEYEVLEGDIEKKTNRLTELINQGYYLVVRVQASPSQHWVAIDRIENGEIYMFDPGSSATVWSEKYTDLVSVYKLKFK